MRRTQFQLFVLIALLALSAAGTGYAASSPGPVRIRFQSGATSAIVSGTLAPHQAQDYVLRAMGGQVMQATLAADANARLAIWGADGTRLKADSAETGWQGPLPKSQDYTVRVSARGQRLNYCLRTTVFGRIQFARGATAATVASPTQRCAAQGVEVVGGYALRAQAGQTMRVSISSPNGKTFLTITGADGQALKYYDDGLRTWQGVLPATQDYYLQPVSTGADPRFSLTVSIDALSQPRQATRIRFAPGAESATVGGTLTGGGSVRYVLWAGRGQRMELNVTTNPSGSAAALEMTVTSPSGQRWYLPLDSVITSLPASGDYTIELNLKPGWRGVNYTLMVRIPAS